MVVLKEHNILYLKQENTRGKTQRYFMHVHQVSTAQVFIVMSIFGLKSKEGCTNNGVHYKPFVLLMHERVVIFLITQGY